MLLHHTYRMKFLRLRVWVLGRSDARWDYATQPDNNSQTHHIWAAYRSANAFANMQFLLVVAYIARQRRGASASRARYSTHRDAVVVLYLLWLLSLTGTCHNVQTDHHRPTLYPLSVGVRAYRAMAGAFPYGKGYSWEPMLLDATLLKTFYHPNSSHARCRSPGVNLLSSWEWTTQSVLEQKRQGSRCGPRNPIHAPRYSVASEIQLRENR
jgi:hypothetical protein